MVILAENRAACSYLPLRLLLTAATGIGEQQTHLSEPVFLKEQSRTVYVVIASGDGIYKMDYNKVLEYHIEKKADITVVCKRMSENEDVTPFRLRKD